MLDTTKVKILLVHPDADVRRAALFHLCHVYNRSTVTADDLWSAIDHDSSNLVDFIVALEHFGQSSRSMQRLIEEAGLGTGESSGIALETLVMMPLDDIKTHADAILALPLHPEAREEIELQLRYVELTANELWDLLRQAGEGIIAEQDDDCFTRAGFLVKALARHPEEAKPLALKELSVRGDEWLEAFSIVLLGRLRAVEATGLILSRMDLYEGDQIEFAIQALVEMGDVSIVGELGRRLQESNMDFQYAAIRVLCCYPIQESQQVLLDFARHPRNRTSDAVGNAQMSLVQQFPDEEEVLSYLRAVSVNNLACSYDTLDADMLTLAKAIGAAFPEIPTWERRVRARGIARVTDMIHQRIDWEENHPEEFPLPDTQLEPAPALKKKLIGRNDPCPCGSGMKYKKCCLDKFPAI